MPTLQRLFPFLSWPAQWREAGVRGDITAGITVALVMIPQALAYAKLAGLPPHVGLYAALVPTVIAALFGSCGQLSTGPVALTGLLVGASILPLAGAAGGDVVGLALLLALLSGLIQLALGLLLRAADGGGGHDAPPVALAMAGRASPIALSSLSRRLFVGIALYSSAVPTISFSASSMSVVAAIRWALGFCSCASAPWMVATKFSLPS
jgi:MFS superfamily sulfate permease-like transporter